MTATITRVNEVRYTSTYDSALGKISLRRDGELLSGLYFSTQLAALADVDRWVIRHDGFDDVKRYLDQYFLGTAPADLPSLQAVGTPFQKAVWNRLRAIRFGETRTYGEIARAIGKPSASRAVGRAIGENPISLIVPCHRVIGGNGNLTGYAGGLAIKRWLLDHEAGAT